MLIHEAVALEKNPRNSPTSSCSHSKQRIDVSVVTTFNSQSYEINEQFLTYLFQQLPKPVILQGRFNRYHEIWENSSKVLRKSGPIFFSQTTF